MDKETSMAQVRPSRSDAKSPLHEHDAELVEQALDLFQSHLEDKDPTIGQMQLPSDLNSALDGILSPEGAGLSGALKAFKEIIEPSLISCASPRFLSFIPSAPSRASILFDAVVSAANLNGISWIENSGVIAAENQTLSLLAAYAGLPPGAGGCFVGGGTAGNLSSLATARREAERRSISPRNAERYRVAVSDQTHSSVSNSLRLLNMEPLVVPTEDYRMTGTALRQAISSLGDGEILAAVVATAGSTNLGVIDDLSGIADAARETGTWFHVDAAYGGGALFADTARPLFKGIEHADSLVIDPHKMLFTPYDCSALIYRDPSLARDAHTQHAAYLDPMHNDQDQEWNPSDYAHHMSRRARGLPLWFSMAVHGIDAYCQAVERTLEIAQYAAHRIRETEHLSLLREPDLSIVAFRREGWTESNYYTWSRKLQEEQLAFILPSRVGDSPMIRLAFVNPLTSFQLIDTILSTTEDQSP
ncbi:aminotransferase class I/II-fold pyridoxal phosphate-dependent enzyme [Streptomyces sp. NPDC004787]|uniref:pyridoxal phosphate-dependent decarboxylase family protein n=1 Tax=Streptomyces sp. NPDC004787 TaxID=3154291 RepID=UPI0033AFBCC8